MKKVLFVLLSFAVISVTAFANVSFSDMDSSHWAYNYVIKLVNDGTVKGYEDGSFRPANTVTRAEFVKMLGCGPERREKDYADVPSTHWGYEYIMTSGFEISGNNFFPNQKITRGETIELIWKRNGSKKGCIAPNVITKQYTKNKDAVAWAYNYKVMIGDDGLNLRLNDTLSRAEAATLIVRSREIDFSLPQSDFKDIVSEDVMKTYFESYKLFDDKREYQPDATITNGEMSRAALRLATDEFNLMYSSFSNSTKFDHPYYKDVSIIADRCIKKGSATAEFADEKANVENTVAAFAYAGLQKTNQLISYGNINNMYSDVSKEMESRKNVLLTFAYEKGIVLKADGTIGALNNVTHKDIAALLIQLDDLIGMETVFSTKKDESGKFVVKDAKLKNNIAAYPANKEDYACIIDGIDNSIYEKEIIGNKPVDSYNFSREYGEVFVTKIQSLSTFIQTKYGIENEILIYPNLVWDDGSKFVLSVKCNVISVEKEISTKDAFGDSLLNNVDETIKPGSSYFVEVTLKYTDLFF